MKVLQFGPIIPNSYSINSYEEQFSNFANTFDVEPTEYGAYPLMNLSDIEQISDQKLLGATMLPVLVTKFGEEDICDKTDTKILFKPFIKGCMYNDDFFTTMENVSYNEFLFPESDTIVDINAKHDKLQNYLHSDKVLCLTPFYKKDWRRDTENEIKNQSRKSNALNEMKTRKANTTNEIKNQSRKVKTINDTEYQNRNEYSRDANSNDQLGGKSQIKPKTVKQVRVKRPIVTSVLNTSKNRKRTNMIQINIQL